MEKAVVKHGAYIEQLKKQVDENSKILQTVHKMAVSIDNLTQTLEKFIKQTDDRAVKQGERLGKVETRLETMSNIPGDLENIEIRLKNQETKGVKKWEGIVSTVITVVVTGVVMYMLMRMGLQ